MADIKTEPIITEEEQDIQYLIEGKDEIPIEEEVETGPSVEELKVEYDKMQVEMERMKVESNLASVWKEGLNDLGEKISTPQPMQANPQQQQKDFEDWKKKSNKDWYKDPTGNALNLYAQKIQPEIEKTLNNKLQYSREFCRLDPDTATMFKRYEAEVDAEVNRMTQLEKNDMKVYQNALKRVGVNHIDELVNEKVEMALKKRDEEEKRLKPANEQFSEANINPRSRPSKTEIISQKDWDKHLLEARAKGFGNDPMKLWRIKHGK